MGIHINLACYDIYAYLYRQLSWRISQGASFFGFKQTVQGLRQTPLLTFKIIEHIQDWNVKRAYIAGGAVVWRETRIIVIRYYKTPFLFYRQVALWPA